MRASIYYIYCNYNTYSRQKLTTTNIVSTVSTANTILGAQRPADFLQA